MGNTKSPVQWGEKMDNIETLTGVVERWRKQQTPPESLTSKFNFELHVQTQVSCADMHGDSSETEHLTSWPLAMEWASERFNISPDAWIRQADESWLAEVDELDIRATIEKN